MRRYAITVEFHQPDREGAISDCIRKLAHEWKHPLSGFWIVKTTMRAREIHKALMPLASSQDRIYICEAGDDYAEFNVLSTSGTKITRIAEARKKSRMLSAIFSRDGQSSRHLKAATSESLKSA
jgi:hypothetical protein